MRPILVPLVLALCLAAPVVGQNDPLEVPGLVELAGREAWVRHTPGSLDRAARVQAWLVLLVSEYAKAERELVVLGAYVLDRREWREAGIETPYGLPRSLGGGRLALPAYGDDGTVAFWRRYQPRGLPRLGGVPIRGTETEAASLLLADHLGLLEMARHLTTAGSVRGAEPWIQDLLAHAFLLQTLETHDASRIRALDEFWRQIETALPDPGPRAGYDAGVTFDEWLAHQARIYGLARAMAERETRWMRLYERFQKLGRKGDGLLDEEILRRRYGEVLGGV
jgi:hypothetical protein